MKRFHRACLFYLALRYHGVPTLTALRWAVVTEMEAGR